MARGDAGILNTVLSTGRMAFVRRNRPRGGCGTGERRRGGECESSDSTHSVHDRRALRQFTRGFTVSSDANLSRSFFFHFLPFLSSVHLLPSPSHPLLLSRRFIFNVVLMPTVSREIFFFPLFLFLFFFSFPLLPSRITFTRKRGRVVGEIIARNSNRLENYSQKFP